MKGTKPKTTGVSSKTTTAVPSSTKTASGTTATTSSSGQRNPSTASKSKFWTISTYINAWLLIFWVLWFRQELKGGISEEAADMHEELRLQGRDQGCQRKGRLQQGHTYMVDI